MFFGERKLAVKSFFNGQRWIDSLFFAAMWIVAAVVILVITWPWAEHFTGEMLKHWDPPFHAWKLSFMANRILDGDVFFSSPNTNLIYPHAGALYFEALCWPCAVVFAILRRLTSWPVEKLYHVTLIGFWSLAAPTAGLLLRRIGVGRVLTFVFGVIWCILPYRISYANEFQMQLTFMIPLFYLAFMSFMNRPGITRGIILAFVWYFFAITELYQAFFILFTVPFLAAAHIRNTPGFFRGRGLWTGCAAAVLTELALMPCMLLPYLRYQAAGDVSRSIKEIIRHSIQPFSWIKPFGAFFPWDIDAKIEEFYAYPTILLMVLTILAAVFWLRCRKSANARSDRWLIIPLVITMVFFGGMTTLHHCLGAHGAFLLGMWYTSALLPILAAIAFVFIKSSSARERFFIGLAGAAVFCFFMSFGPTLDVREKVLASTFNPIYMFFFKFIPPVTSFRAACRFGVYTHFFMLLVSAVALQKLCSMPRRHGKSITTLAGAIALAAVWIEAVPPVDFIRFRPVDDCEDSPVIKQLAEKVTEDGYQSFVLAPMPMGRRSSDGMIMLSLMQDRFLSMHAWCGYIPPFSMDTAYLSNCGKFEDVTENLAKIWPPCFVIVDKTNDEIASPSYVKAFPKYVRKNKERQNVVNYVRAFKLNGWTELMKDKRFSVLEYRESPAAENIEKIFRYDFAKRFPVIHARLTGTADTDVSVLFNGKEITAAKITADGTADISAALPSKFIKLNGHNVLVFSATHPIAVTLFHLGKE